LAFVIDLTVVEAITMTILQTTAAALFALSLAAPAFAADGVPKLNVRPTCHPIDASDKTIRIDTERCLKTENDAREQLVRQWADFPAADRALCTRTATLCGPSRVGSRARQACIQCWGRAEVPRRQPEGSAAHQEAPREVRSNGGRRQDQALGTASMVHRLTPQARRELDALLNIKPPRGAR